MCREHTLVWPDCFAAGEPSWWMRTWGCCHSTTQKIFKSHCYIRMHFVLAVLLHRAAWFTLTKKRRKTCLCPWSVLYEPSSWKLVSRTACVWFHNPQSISLYPVYVTTFLFSLLVLYFVFHIMICTEKLTFSMGLFRCHHWIQRCLTLWRTSEFHATNTKAAKAP